MDIINRGEPCGCHNRYHLEITLPKAFLNPIPVRQLSLIQAETDNGDHSEIEPELFIGHNFPELLP